MKHTYVYASGKLLRETYGDTIIDFFYSTSGQPYALKHNGTTYYYITNVQGDVMSIVDGTGAVVAEYEYDPYGNILSTAGTLADTLGQINPLRYRGYVYDQECNLYYLQSRYYDPGMGRFLNADALVSTGQGILGNNMFAYCGNKPVKYADPTGHAYYVLGIESGSMTTNSMLACPGGGGGANITHVAASRRESVNIFKRELEYLHSAVNFVNNTSEEKVLTSTGLSFYKGVPVIRCNLPGDGTAFSFGIIVLDDYYIDNEYGIDTLKHEYGHSQHMKDIGVVTYFSTTAVPSLIGNGLDRLNVLPEGLYYNLPWEHVADMYGGVSRNTHANWAQPAAEAFWVYTVVVSIWTGGVI